MASSETPFPWRSIFPQWEHAVCRQPELQTALGVVNDADLDYIRSVESSPKVELHIHAEAAVGASFYDSLRRKHNVSGETLNDGSFAGFDDFLKRWIANVMLFRSPDDYTELAHAFVKNRELHNIVYSECHFSGLDSSIYRRRFRPELPALNLEDVIRSFIKGIKEASSKSQVRAILDVVHLATEENIDEVKGVLEHFVDSKENQDVFGERILVGIGLGGPERPDLAPWFAEKLKPLREMGLKLDLHSGEQVHVSPEDHGFALKHLKPERVGHGFRGFSQGVFHEGSIALCPLSNTLLKCHNSLETHPVAKMYEQGLNISINTDDPLLLGTTLSLEYLALNKVFGLGESFFKQTQKNAQGQVFCKKTLERGLLSGRNLERN